MHYVLYVSLVVVEIEMLFTNVFGIVNFKKVIRWLNCKEEGKLNVLFLEQGLRKSMH